MRLSKQLNSIHKDNSQSLPSSSGPKDHPGVGRGKNSFSDADVCQQPSLRLPTIRCMAQSVLCCMGRICKVLLSQLPRRCQFRKSRMPTFLIKCHMNYCCQNSYEAGYQMRSAPGERLTSLIALESLVTTKPYSNPVSYQRCNATQSLALNISTPFLHKWRLSSNTPGSTFHMS